MRPLESAPVQAGAIQLEIFIRYDRLLPVMTVEATSAGAILFRDTRGHREYLLLKSRPGDWEFPKGGVEGDEELQQTAIREVGEEAGIEDFRLIDGFREEYDYVFEAGGNTIHKTVHLFIARSFEASAELSNEHRDLQWRDYEQAINTITQDGPREILEQAHDYLDDLVDEAEAAEGGRTYLG